MGAFEEMRGDVDLFTSDASEAVEIGEANESGFTMHPDLVEFYEIMEVSTYKLGGNRNEPFI